MRSDKTFVNPNERFHSISDNRQPHTHIHQIINGENFLGEKLLMIKLLKRNLLFFIGSLLCFCIREVNVEEILCNYYL